MTALGFIQFSLSWVFRNEVCDVAFYAGFADGVDTGNPDTVWEAMIGMNQAWEDATSETFNPTRLSAMHLPEVTFGQGRLLGKGGLNQDSQQLSLIMPPYGTRSVLEGNQPLPPEVTVSCYAARNRVRGRGAKVGFTGAVEADWDGKSWIFTLGSFPFLVRQFVQSWPSFLSIVSIDTGIQLKPVVVPRVLYTPPSGKVATRLPDRFEDAAVTFEITPYLPSQYTGSADTRQLPLR